MNVVYACDDKYAMLAGVSMKSLLEVNDTELNIYILSNGVSNDNQKRLLSIAEKYDCEINIVELNDAFQSNIAHIDAQRWSLAAFARLFMPIILPDVSKIIYLDCDILVRKPLDQIWNWPLDGHSCAAVSEPISPGHKKNVKLDKKDTYYNSGVMLIDLDKWRERNMLDSFLKCINRHSGYVPYVDQGVINEVLKEDIVSLPTTYNVATVYFEFSYEELNRYRMDQNKYSNEEILNAIKDPYILHFTSSFLTPRPWIEGSNHPWADEWEKVCKETPWHSASKWPDSPGKTKLILRWIFRHTPRAFGITIAMLINSYIRPLTEARYITR